MRTCCHLRLIYFNSAFCFIYLRKPYCASKLLSRSSWWCLFLCENPLFKSVTLFAVFARLVHAEFVTGVFSNHAARTPAQSFGDRRPGSWQNVHHKALRPPGVLPALPGHHRSGLRTQSAQLGPQNSGEAAAVGHRRYVNHTVIVLWVEWHTAAQVNAHSPTQETLSRKVLVVDAEMTTLHSTKPNVNIWIFIQNTSDPHQILSRCSFAHAPCCYQVSWKSAPNDLSKPIKS